MTLWANDLNPQKPCHCFFEGNMSWCFDVGVFQDLADQQRNDGFPPRRWTITHGQKCRRNSNPFSSRLQKWFKRKRSNDLELTITDLFLLVDSMSLGSIYPSKYINQKKTANLLQVLLDQVMIVQNSKLNHRWCEKLPPVEKFNWDFLSQKKMDHNFWGAAWIQLSSISSIQNPSW